MVRVGLTDSWAEGKPACIKNKNLSNDEMLVRLPIGRPRCGVTTQKHFSDHLKTSKPNVDQRVCQAYAFLHFSIAVEPWLLVRVWMDLY